MKSKAALLSVQIQFEKGGFAFLFLVCNCTLDGVAEAQTACPKGTAAGSATCGPAPSSSTGYASSQEIPAPRAVPLGRWIKTRSAIACSPTSGSGASIGKLSKKEAEIEAWRVVPKVERKIVLSPFLAEINVLHILFQNLEWATVLSSAKDL
ncbi:hypothetical protein GGR67_002063 [Xanthomonas arboricola]|nr:hypothetical protein [Xanthomonas euroxanthea]MBB5767995.1 hypothetical protein [Xanthomonas euroxanthea]